MQPREKPVKIPVLRVKTAFASTAPVPCQALFNDFETIIVFNPYSNSPSVRVMGGREGTPLNFI